MMHIKQAWGSELKVTAWQVEWLLQALCGLWMALKASYTKTFSVSLDPSYSLRIYLAEVFDAPQTAGAKWLVNVKVKSDSLEFKPANVVPLLWKQQGFHVSHGQSKTSSMLENILFLLDHKGFGFMPSLMLHFKILCTNIFLNIPFFCCWSRTVGEIL